MSTRVIRIEERDTRSRGGVRTLVDPAGTALMVAISGTVLAVALLVASMSAVDGGASLGTAQRPQPGPPPPTLATPQPGAAPTSH